MWLVRLRWWSAGAQVVAVWLSWLGVIQSLPSLPILSAAGVIGATNLGFNAAHPRLPASRLIAMMLVFDVCLLSLVLFLTGGASNPLSVLYLVHIALAAVMLPARWAWLLTLLSVAAFGALFLSPSLPAAGTHHAPRGGPFHMHLRGMWLAFSLAALLIAFFVSRIASSLRLREQQLAEARARVMRAEKVASLASLAAGTAHELGTPIASIALASTEMDRLIRSGASPDALAEDVRLIEGEAKRCRAIVDQMIRAAGDTAGEAPRWLPIRSLIEATLELLPAHDAPRVHVDVAPTTPRVRLPVQAVAQALANLLRNALEATPDDRHVELRAEAHARGLRLQVVDHGPGMSEENLKQATEPFVTTKRSHGGLGLGLFLASATATRLNGRLGLQSRRGEGTRAVLELPLDVLEQQERAAHEHDERQ